MSIPIFICLVNFFAPYNIVQIYRTTVQVDATLKIKITTKRNQNFIDIWYTG